MRALLLLVLVTLVNTTQDTSWGGDHIEIRGTAKGADVEFDCAHGTIDQAIPTRHGTFTLKGTFTPETHGPARDDGPKGAKASYRVVIKEDTMTLHLKIEGEDGPGRDFSLTRNRSGNLFKCR